MVVSETEIKKNNNNKLNCNIFKIKAMDATFKNNQMLPIHRWYPYIEGFSENFVKSILNNYTKDIVVYDPFNGSGTTTLTASSMGISSCASEINPLMRFIAETKVNTVKNIIDNNKINLLDDLFRRFTNTLYKKQNINEQDIINCCYMDKDFFDEITLKKLAYIKNEILNIDDQDIKNIFTLSLASIIVEVSNMVRAADLRKKTLNERMIVSDDVFVKYLNKLSNIIKDINEIKDLELKNMYFISENAKNIELKHKGTIDLIITSPPYVNGTNYFRNTKLELWILDYINNENDLKYYREQAITAGINNVSIKNEIDFLDFIEPYAKKLDKISPDKRIPKMIRAYFSDMNKVFFNFNSLLKDGGKIYFDIGDSEYYGIHIPVDKLIQIIAINNGFCLEQENVLRKRKSKNGNSLTQKLLIFSKRV